LYIASDKDGVFHKKMIHFAAFLYHMAGIVTMFQVLGGCRSYKSVA
jgi:hypothetical protein